MFIKALTQEQIDHVKALIQALRSGKYIQTRFRLRRSDPYFMRAQTHRYCCLGVACDISGLSEWTPDNLYLGKEGNLPEAVRNWYGFNFSDPFSIPSSRLTSSLTSYNDQKQNTFEEIADIIEKELAKCLSLT